MKVLFVTREYPPFEVGGVAVHTFNLVKNLTKLGVSCKVLSFGDGAYSSDVVKFVDSSSSIIERSTTAFGSDLRIPADILRFSRIANDMIKKEKFDIVHVEEPYVGALVNCKHEIKITTIHDTSYGEIQSIVNRIPGNSGFKRTIFYFSLGFYLEFMCIASSRALIVPTMQVRNELLKVYRTSPSKVRTIQNGVELPEFGKVDKTGAKSKLGVNPESILIVSIGRITGRKRLDLLVKAAKLLSDEKCDNFKIVIAGDGTDRCSLLNLVEQLGQEHIIETPGWISQQQRDLLYRAADIFVLSSDYEGFPLTLLEAMSYGAAIVSSKISGLGSMRDGIECLFFPFGNYRGLADCIRKLLNDALLRKRLSISARNFSEKFSWDSVARETKRVYESLLFSNLRIETREVQISKLDNGALVRVHSET